MDEQTAPRARPDWDRLVTGVLMVALGVTWLLSTADVVSPNWRVLLPAALAAVGLVAVVLALSGRRAELTGTGVLLSVLVVVATVLPANLGWRIGEQEVRPGTVGELRSEYSHGIGTLTIDLRELALESDARVAASNGIGELVVLVPAAVALDVDARVGVGTASVVGREANGFNARADEHIPGAGPTLELELSAGVGEIRVER